MELILIVFFLLLFLLFEDLKVGKNNNEGNKRKYSTACEFDKGVTKEEFIEFATKAKKRIKRIIDIETDGPIVTCTVVSQSGISEWEFVVDFNDHGHLTGEYTIYTDNSDSNVQDGYAKFLSKMIKEKIEQETDNREANYDEPQFSEEEAHLIVSRYRYRRKIQTFIIILGLIWIIIYLVSDM